MVRCGHPDVLAQVARGIANFAKCESRASTQGKDASYGFMEKIFMCLSSKSIVLVTLNIIIPSSITS